METLPAPKWMPKRSQFVIDQGRHRSCGRDSNITFNEDRSNGPTRLKLEGRHLYHSLSHFLQT